MCYKPPPRCKHLCVKNEENENSAANQPTHQPGTSNSIVQLPRPGGVGNREALKAPRSKLGNPPKEPRPPPPEPASAMLAACGDSPKDGDVVVIFFFLGGGWRWIEDKSVLGFLVEFFFRFRFFFSFWCGWRISKFISIVLAYTQKFIKIHVLNQSN